MFHVFIVLKHVQTSVHITPYCKSITFALYQTNPPLLVTDIDEIHVGDIVSPPAYLQQHILVTNMMQKFQFFSDLWVVRKVKV